MTTHHHQPAARPAASRFVARATLAALVALLLALASRARTPAQAAPAPVQASSETARGDHGGPAVAPPGSPARGPARWVASIHDRFDLARALADAIFIDGFYRTPASPLYDACLDRIQSRLEAAGFSSEGSSLRLLSCGGAPISRAFIERGYHMFNCPFFVSYGITESCGKLAMSMPYRVLKHL